MKKMNKKGFTIVELVIVIAVIAILAAVLIPTFSSVVNKANYSSAESSARNAITAGLQMTSNTALPKGTKIFVDANKNGEPDYAFNYDGNAMASTELYGEDGKVVGGILNSATKKGNSTEYYKFNNILTTASYVDTQYVATQKAYDKNQTYYTRTGTGTDGDPYVYTKATVLAADLDNGDWKDDAAGKYFVAVLKLDDVLINNMKAVTGATNYYVKEDGSSVVFYSVKTYSNEDPLPDGLLELTDVDVRDYYEAATLTETSTPIVDDEAVAPEEDTRYYKFDTYEFNVFSSTDMPVNSFILVYLG